MPIKCPVAPLEFILADSFLNTSIFATKLTQHSNTFTGGAFTKTKLQEALIILLEEKI